MVGWLDRLQRRNRPVGFAVAVVYKYVDDQGGYLAALITYYAFVSLFPALLLLTTVLGVVRRVTPTCRNRSWNPPPPNSRSIGYIGGITGVRTLMTFRNARLALAGFITVAVACSTAGASSGPVPAPAVDLPRATAHSTQTIVVSGRLLLGHPGRLPARERRDARDVRLRRRVGRDGTVRDGRHGHDGPRRVRPDCVRPVVTTYGQLLRVFFSVAHDPTELNRQGPDEGTQYRSVIWVSNEDEARVAHAYIAQLDAAKVFRGGIVTEVAPLKGFYAAEDYHQDYARLHPSDLYIMINDAPKVANLKTEFPDLYIER